MMEGLVENTQDEVTVR